VTNRRRLALTVALVAAMALSTGGLTACSTAFSNPKSVVEGYLNALAAGNAAQALSYGSNVGFLHDEVAGPFLTDAALAASAAIAPMKVISVGDAQITEGGPAAVPDATAYVPATYSFGDRQITHTFTAERLDGRWYLDYTCVDVSISGPIPGSTHDYDDWFFSAGDGVAVGLTLNGQPISARIGLLMFPGTYQIAVSNPLVELTGGSFAIDYPAADQRSNTNWLDVDAPGSLDLTAAAQAQLGRLAKSAFDTCLSRPGALGTCLFLPIGTQQLDQSSLMWQIVPLSGASDAPAYDMSQWRFSLSEGVAISADPTGGGDPRGYIAQLVSGRWLDGSAIDMSSLDHNVWAAPPSGVCASIADPDNITIGFSDGSVGFAPSGALSIC